MLLHSKKSYNITKHCVMYHTLIELFMTFSLRRPRTFWRMAFHWWRSNNPCPRIVAKTSIPAICWPSFQLNFRLWTIQVYNLFTVRPQMEQRLPPDQAKNHLRIPIVPGEGPHTDCVSQDVPALQNLLNARPRDGGSRKVKHCNQFIN